MEMELIYRSICAVVYRGKLYSSQAIYIRTDEIPPDTKAVGAEGPLDSQ